jgi:hypothetical protein
MHNDDPLRAAGRTVIMTTKGPSSVALAGTENGHGSNGAPLGAPLPGPGREVAAGALLPGPDREAAAGAQAPAAGDWAICCSGGGIRSAAYCLGALQSLDRGGLLSKVKWILGVSGGSYIATSRALVAHHLRAGTQPTAYAPGTPEELSLRYDSRYIAPNGSTILVGALSMLLGAAGALVIVLTPLYALTHAWGWLLRGQHVLISSGPRAMTATVTSPGWWLCPVIVGAVVLVAFLFWWGTLGPDTRRPGGPLMWLNPDSRDRGSDRARVVSWAAMLAVGLALAMIAAPLLISWLTSQTGSLGTITHFLGFGARPTWSWSAAAALFAAVTAVARYAQAGLAKWTASTSAAKAQSAATPSLLTQLAGSIRQRLMPWVASAVIVAGGVILALLWISDGARAGFSAGQLLPVAVALAVTLLARVGVNVNRLSLHDAYRWRLADAFAVTRDAAEAAAEPGRRVRARTLFAQAAATRLSQLRHDDGTVAARGRPGLVVCATANINAVREVPPGQDGFCVTFDPEYVALHREKGLAAAERARARTPDYEALIGHRRSTLFDISAISGAAVSPLMGSATIQAYRILFTATDIRLGVWLPHPAVVRDARLLLDHAEDPDYAPRRWWERHPLLLLLWYLSPHRLWDHDQNQAPGRDENAGQRGTREEMGRDSEREARLWAHVLQLKLAGKRSGTLWYRALQPTLGLLWAEAAGRLSYRATWMYVTDGGHYDNLGLVEALRRGASHIVVLDASGDKADTWTTLGGAIALARSDTGVEIELNPTTMRPSGLDLAPGQVARPWAHGSFWRSQAAPGLPRQGEIWVCKLGWWTGAPWDVRAYAGSHPTYPTDSTLEQLYDATEFNAYQQLGAASVLDAARHCAPPLAWVPAPAPEISRPVGDGLASRLGIAEKEMA